MQRLRGLGRSRMAILALMIGSSFTAGVLFSRPLQAGRFDPYKKMTVFAKVLSYIESNYVEDVSEADLMYGAARGLTDTLDPHSRFMSPDEYDRLRKETEGDPEITGIGIDLEKKKRGLVVVSPIDGSPAARAGIEPGDLILKIDGADVDDFDDAVNRIQGPPGSKVVLTLERREREMIVPIVREKFEVKAVEGRMLEDGYGLVKLRIFSANTDNDMLEVLEDLKKKADAKGGLKGLVLDLRRNPGGLLDQGVKVADRFISEGLIVRTVGKGGRELDRHMAHSRGTWSGFPMIVLVDGATASAAEIVAGALQDHERALLMGTPTFGKGSVQTVINIDGCGATPCGLKLTVSLYYTPSGRSIQTQGLQPNILVDAVAPSADLGDADTLRERNYERHLKNTQGEKTAERPRMGDYQLQMALDYLKSWAVFSKHATKKG